MAACTSGRGLYSNISPGDPDIHRQDMTADPVGEACRLIDDFLEQP